MAEKVEAIWIAVGGQKTRTGYYAPSLSAANFVAEVAADGTLDDIHTAMEALSDCTLEKQTVQVLQHVGAETVPTVATARRKWGARVFYADAVNGQKGSFTIPGIKVARMPTTGDVIDLGSTGWVDLVTAFEAGAQSADDNDVTITKAIMIGRRA